MLTTKKAARLDLIASILEKAGPRFVTLRFRKRDGTMRDMTIQPAASFTRVEGAKTPAGARAARTRRRNHPNLLPVWDVRAKGFRSVNLDTVESIRSLGVELRIGA